MRIGARAGAALAAVVAVAAMVVAAGSASATDDTATDDTVATAVGEGSNPLFTFAFDVAQESSDPRDARGTFRAAGVSPTDLLVAPMGPAMCVDVRGNTAGFLYPLAEGSRPAALQGQNVLITAVDNGPGRQDFLGFLPVGIDPGGCAPNLAPLPMTSGDIVVRDAG